MNTRDIGQTQDLTEELRVLREDSTQMLDLKQLRAHTAKIAPSDKGATDETATTMLHGLSDLDGPTPALTAADDSQTVSVSLPEESPTMAFTWSELAALREQAGAVAAPLPAPDPFETAVEPIPTAGAADSGTQLITDPLGPPALSAPVAATPGAGFPRRALLVACAVLAIGVAAAFGRGYLERGSTADAATTEPVKAVVDEASSPTEALVRLASAQQDAATSEQAAPVEPSVASEPSQPLAVEPEPQSAPPVVASSGETAPVTVAEQPEEAATESEQPIAEEPQTDEAALAEAAAENEPAAETSPEQVAEAEAVDEPQEAVEEPLAEAVEQPAASVATEAAPAAPRQPAATTYRRGDDRPDGRPAPWNNGQARGNGSAVGRALDNSGIPNPFGRR